MADSRLVSRGGGTGVVVGVGVNEASRHVRGSAVKVCVREGNSCHWFLSTHCHRRFLLRMKYTRTQIPPRLCENARPGATLSKELDLDVFHL